MTKSHLYTCTNCGRQYNHQVLKKCPVCRTETNQRNPETYEGADTFASHSILDTTSKSKTFQSEHETQQWSTAKRKLASDGQVLADLLIQNGDRLRIIGIASAILVSLFNIFVIGRLVENFFLSSLISLVTVGIFGISIITFGNLLKLVSTYFKFRMSE